MRNIWILCALMIALPMWSNTKGLSDTTVYYKGNKFELSDSDSPVEVKVYTKKGEKMEQIYEGKFENGEKKSSKWEMKEVFSLPFLDQKKESKDKKPTVTKKKERMYYHFEPRWSGIGVGFIYPTDASFNVIRDYSEQGVSLNEARSFEFFINIHDFGLPLYKNILGLSSGFGLNWRNMSLDGNKIFTRLNDHELGIKTVAGNTKYSTMMTVDVVVPLLLEWHIAANRNSGFSIAAGAQLNIKAYSCAISKFQEDGQDRKTFIRGIGSKPLSGDAIIQVGYRYITLYAKRAITPMFIEGKGPKLYPTSIGAMFTF